MKTRAAITLWLWLAALGAPIHAQPSAKPGGAILLVDEGEARAYQGDAGFLQPPPLRTRAIAPSIEIDQPQPVADLKLKSPFAITLRFRAAGDAAIVPASFRVLYGALNLDITSRITAHVQVTPEGLSFDRAQIPRGRHKLTLRVQDEKQRTGERELRFEVE